jgi:hypothetical protein
MELVGKGEGIGRRRRGRSWGAREVLYAAPETWCAFLFPWPPDMVLPSRTLVTPCCSRPRLPQSWEADGAQLPCSTMTVHVPRPGETLHRARGHQHHHLLLLRLLSLPVDFMVSYASFEQLVPFLSQRGSDCLLPRRLSISVRNCTKLLL